jgi:hypothetical protein
MSRNLVSSSTDQIPEPVLLLVNRAAEGVQLASADRRMSDLISGVECRDF